MILCVVAVVVTCVLEFLAVRDLERLPDTVMKGLIARDRISPSCRVTLFEGVE